MEVLPPPKVYLPFIARSMIGLDVVSRINDPNYSKALALLFCGMQGVGSILKHADSYSAELPWCLINLFVINKF